MSTPITTLLPVQVNTTDPVSTAAARDALAAHVATCEECVRDLRAHLAECPGCGGRESGSHDVRTTSCTAQQALAWKWFSADVSEKTKPAGERSDA
jgi:hypothetical protein